MPPEHALETERERKVGAIVVANEGIVAQEQWYLLPCHQLKLVSPFRFVVTREIDHDIAVIMMMMVVVVVVMTVVLA